MPSATRNLFEKRFRYNGLPKAFICILSWHQFPFYCPGGNILCKLQFEIAIYIILLKYPDAGTLQAGPASGAIFENFIITEVLKYKLNHNLLVDLYFYRDSNHNEVDLVLDYGLHQKLFEIKMSRTLKTEFFSTLERISPLFPQSERFLVSLSSEATFYKNSKAIPWYDLPGVIE